ncbi:hypothetical protein R75471_05241 [Paraburkholderia domus]|uniref:hypothetical protein n=1 Tax=Paraburkholderia domus TaxID=2793075 RepID=UPI001B1894D9|nr:hypothetical protein [Paraburkholderia domus]CAE6939203.1 hypothetical protein R75471_05241 [Paraburkholderia domus]
MNGAQRGNTSIVVAHPPSLPDKDNPLLEGLPTVPSLQEAMDMIEEQYLDFDVSGLSEAEIVAYQSKHAIVPNVQFANAFVQVITQVRDSCRSRDLRTFDYRNYTKSCNHFVATFPRPSFRKFPMCFGIAPGAKSRGMIVATPAYTGRSAFADSVQKVLGRDPSIKRVTVGENFVDYPRLPVLRVQWPIDGKLSGFITAFVAAFDLVFDTEYSKVLSSLFFMDREYIPALCSLGNACHLGLLIVERINYENVRTPAAELTWSAIAQFTRSTGIPVLCLPTPGAALTLSTLTGSRSDLTAAGVTEIMRPLSAQANHWKYICAVQFDATLGAIGLGSMPEWLPDSAYTLTLGYPGLLAKVLTYIAQNLLSMNTSGFDQKTFEKYGGRALVLEQPHLDAVRTIRRKGAFKPSTLLRHADWLSFDELAPTHLKPELQ